MTSAVGLCLCDPATGGTTDAGGTLGHLLLITGRVDGVIVGRFALDDFAPVTSGGGRAPVEPATAVRPTRGDAGAVLSLTGRVDGV